MTEPEQDITSTDTSVEFSDAIELRANLTILVAGCGLIGRVSIALLPWPAACRIDGAWGPDDLRRGG